jgi:hypothetical protein
MNGTAAVCAWHGREAQAGHWGDLRRQRPSAGTTPAERESEDLLQADEVQWMNNQWLTLWNNGCSDVLLHVAAAHYFLRWKNHADSDGGNRP